jgi:uncharacterized protein (DUF1501 family)
MLSFDTPDGMSRRHFMSHLAGASAMAIPAITLTRSIQAQAAELSQNRKAAILLWMGGGPSTIDMWDLKPGAGTGGPFRPISTSGAGQISEYLPRMASQMHNLSIVRSMSTREADHNRGRYYMHTGYVPNPSVKHPSYGSVIAHQLAEQRPELEIPPFVAVGGGSVGPGFLGMSWAPFVVNSDGQVRNVKMGLSEDRVARRISTLGVLEKNFIDQRRGQAAEDHAQVLDKTYQMMTSQQLQAFKIDQENQATRDLYGTSGFGRGCLMARRLVEAGVPFVEVDFGGWDNHTNIFPTLQDQRLPRLDQAFSALMADLEQRGMMDNVAVICMGEFGRTPRINGDAGRDHWARAWSVVVGGAGFARGKVIGETNEDGTMVNTEPYTSQDLMASTCQALGIRLDQNFTSRNGRPMKIANSGKVIRELFA